MPLQPEDDGADRKLAHSLRLPFARMIAPAALSWCTTNASLGVLPASAHEPAVVGMPVVSMLSLTMIGIPSSGRSSPLARASSAAAAEKPGFPLHRHCDGGDPARSAARKRREGPAISILGR